MMPRDGCIMLENTMPTATVETIVGKKIRERRKLRVGSAEDRITAMNSAITVFAPEVSTA